MGCGEPEHWGLGSSLPAAKLAQAPAQQADPVIEDQPPLLRHGSRGRGHQLQQDMIAAASKNALTRTNR